MALFKCKMCGAPLELGEDNIAICEYCGVKQTVSEPIERTEVKVVMNETAVVQTAAASASDALVKRGMMALEDKNWEAAAEFFEQALNQNPESSDAFLGKVLRGYRFSSVQQLAESTEDLSENRNFLRALQYASEEQVPQKIQAQIEENIRAKITKLPELRNRNALVRGMIAAGDGVTIGLKADGTVALAGAEAYKHRAVLDWTDIVFIVCARDIIGIKADGTVVINNEERQCDVAEWSDIATVAASYSHIVGIRANGTALAAGSDQDGQCNVSDWCDIVAIAAGRYHTVGLKSDGTVIATGNNSRHQCDVLEWTDIVAIAAADDFTVGLKSDGKVVATGLAGDRTVSYWSNIVAVVASDGVIVGLTGDGTIVSTDSRGDFHWKDIVAVAVGDGHVAWLYADGRTDARIRGGYKNMYDGDKEFFLEDRLFQSIDTLEQESTEDARREAKKRLERQREEKVKYLQNARGRLSEIRRHIAPVRASIAAGKRFAVGIMSDGTVVTTEPYHEAQEWTDIVAVAVQDNGVIGLKSDGTVMTVGVGPCPGVEEWTDILAVSANSYTVGLKFDGTVVAASWIEQEVACNVADWTDIVAIAAGGFHNVGLRADGTVVAAGENHFGECNVDGWTDIVAVAAGLGHTVGLRADGTVMTAGLTGECAWEVSEWVDIVAVAAVKDYTIGLKADGTLVYTGDEEDDLYNIKYWKNIVGVFAGEGCVIGLKADGTIELNDFFQCDGWTLFKPRDWKLFDSLDAIHRRREKAEEMARKEAEEAAQREAEEAARKAAEEVARREAEERARREAEERARREAEERARKEEEEKLRAARREESRLAAEQARAEAERRAKRNTKITALVAIPAVCALVALVIVLTTVVIPNNKYNDAIAWLKAGNVVDAYETLISLNGYKDSNEKANSISNQYKVEKLKATLRAAKAGDYVFFGSYEQDNVVTNGKEPIEWQVLGYQADKALLISRYGLDNEPYNTSYADVTWETCTLRQWLNQNFINMAFSANEKAAIPTVTVSADENPFYDRNPGNATQDKVFLLSTTEALTYDSARACKPTDYADAKGVWVDKSNGLCSWWLRSPGRTQNEADNVDETCDIDEFGSYVNYTGNAVRPALWIDLSV